MRSIVISVETGRFPQFLYAEAYRDRGNADLFIKEHKVGLESDQKPRQRSEANQFGCCCIWSSTVSASTIWADRRPKSRGGLPAAFGCFEYTRFFLIVTREAGYHPNFQ